MKVYINKPRNHWLSPYTIAEKIVFWRRVDILDDPLADKIHEILMPVMEVIQKVLNVIHPKINYVKIDKWDTWSMDTTLAPIVLPMLKQLKATKHGSPLVDDVDVPEELHYMKGKSKKAQAHNENLIHERWDWVMNEMIWAFEQIVDEDSMYDKIDMDSKGWGKRLKTLDDRINHGTALFGKYFRALWD